MTIQRWFRVWGWFGPEYIYRASEPIKAASSVEAERVWLASLEAAGVRIGRAPVIGSEEV